MTIVTATTTGRIFDIMKYSIHDGPGIRTTVFFKGCPLRCWWCHNPESQSTAPELMLWPDRCIACGECLQVCAHGAVSQVGGAIVTNPDRCQDCLTCVGVCYSGARSAAGRTASVDEVMAEVAKDAIFYDESGGGVTFSGGEPLMQPDFLAALLERCKAREYRTAVETSGYGKLNDLLRVSDLVDLFLYDVKLMDEAAHRTYTGVSNRFILGNLRELSRQHANIHVRIPVIPGVNDSPANLAATGRFVADLPGVREIHLLPYHTAGAQKYRRLARTYELPDTQPPNGEAMNRLAESMQIYGKSIKIGG